MTKSKTPQIKKTKSNNNGAVIRAASFYQGPLPHPSVLRGFEEVAPGSANIIVKMASDNAVHRISIENKVIGNDVELAKKGSERGFIIALASLVLCAGMVYTGNSGHAAIVASAMFASLTGVFILGKKGKITNLVQKREDVNKPSVAEIDDKN